MGITINRITETYGMFRHTREEIKEMCKLCHDYGCELLLSTGPRATYDTGATVLSEQGVRVSYRLRGQEQLIRAIEDIKRGYDLGCRGFLAYDEGMLWVVNEMRKNGDLPKEIIFKTSAHLGHCNHGGGEEQRLQTNTLSKEDLLDGNALCTALPSRGVFTFA